MHAHYGLSGVVALAAPRRLPLVLTVHGRDCHHPVVKRLTGLVARRAAAVVAVSAELAAHCPFAVERGDPARGRPRRRSGLFPAPRRAPAWASTPAPGAACSSFRPTRRAPKSALPTPARWPSAWRATRPDVELRAVFGRPRAEMPLWLNAADAVLVTSEREGYGLACVEALACDVPVLATPVGVAPTLLAGVEGCLCAPFEASRWATHVEALLAADEPRVAGRAVAETQGLPATARRTAAALPGALGSRDPVAGDLVVGCQDARELTLVRHGARAAGTPRPRCSRPGRAGPRREGRCERRCRAFERREGPI